VGRTWWTCSGGGIIAYAAGTTQATMTDQADDMIKAVVHDNLESDAVAIRT